MTHELDRASRDNQKPSLTTRASLTFMSQLLSHVASFLVGIFVTPFIVHGLGSELYGAWAVLQRAASFTTGVGSLNSCSALKLRLTTSQHSFDVDLKRRWIGATLVLWLITSPLVIATGWFIARNARALIDVSAVNGIDIQWAVMILVVASPLGTLLSIPSVALRAENLDYKAMGLNATLVLGSGTLNALSIALGYGISGLAFTTLLGVVMVNGARWLVACRALPWLGVNLPELRDIVAIAKLSGWVTLLSLTSFFMTMYDVMLVGFLFGPTEAAVYSLTGTAARLLSTPVSQVLSSANPGHRT